MSFAALHLPSLPLQALLRDDPALVGKPVAVVAGEGRHAAVLHASPEAVQVSPGLPTPLALSRCPGLTLLPRRPDAETEAQRLLLAAGFTLSPRVENTRAGLVTLDLQGHDPGRTHTAASTLRLGFAAQGLDVRIGISTTPLLAELAALRADWALEVTDTSAFLAPLPLATVSPQPAQASLLAKWGIHTLGDLCTLPKEAIAQRLGTEGALLWERASGEATRVLHLVNPPRTFAASWDCEPPVETLEPLLFRLQRFGERLAAELRAAQFAASSLALTLCLEDETDVRREFRLPEPSVDPSAWLRVLHTHLGTVRTTARITGVRLVATPVRPPQKQEGLFDAGLRDPLSFWELLARLGALVGDSRVGTPRIPDTHRPDAVELVRPLEALEPLEREPLHPSLGYKLRRYRPPRPVEVSLVDGQPATLMGGALRGKIVEAAGPWMTGGDWWKPEAWWRETWQVRLEGGGCYQILRSTGGWQVEGMLD
ncbi:MAG: DNA polymerase Y family protein [Opitutaceae bacterium]|nr:DNA polymerase Y family protein [Opitutaceae bacterium]